MPPESDSSSSRSRDGRQRWKSAAKEDFFSLFFTKEPVSERARGGLLGNEAFVLGTGCRRTSSEVRNETAGVTSKIFGGLNIEFIFLVVNLQKSPSQHVY